MIDAPPLPDLVAGQRVQVVDAKDRNVLRRYRGAVGVLAESWRDGLLVLRSEGLPAVPIDEPGRCWVPQTVIVEPLP